MLVFTSGFSGAEEKTGSSIKYEVVNSLVKSVQPTQSIKSSTSIGSIQSIQSIESVKHRIKPLNIKNHRRAKRNSLKMYTKNFNWVGNNIAGARSKWASVKRWIRIKSPSILSLQETKFQIAGKHKLDGYISYEHLRTQKTAGGGLLLAVKTELNPALVRDGGENVEAITVDIFATISH